MTNIVVVCQEEHEKGYEDYVGVCLLCEIERAVLAEREACALLCSVRSHRDNDMGAILARVIRARGNQ